MSIKNPEPKF